MKAWKMAWLNIKRSPVISGLLLFAMSLCIGTLGLLYRVESLQSQRWESMAPGAPVVVGPKQGGIDLLLSTFLLEIRNLEPIPFRLFETIRAKQAIQFEDKTQVSNENIDLAVPLLMMAKSQEHWVLGSETTAIQRLFLKQGHSFLKEGKWFQGEKEIVLGAKWASRNGLHIGDSLQAQFLGPRGEETSEAGNLVISGILPETNSVWDEAAFGDLHLGWKIYDVIGKVNPVTIWGSQVLHYFFLFPENSKLSELSTLINQRSVAQLIMSENEKRHLNSILGETRYLSFLISGLMLLIGFVVITALMILRFQSQASQLAALKAIGFSNRRLFSWMGWECLILLLGSLALGTLWTQAFWTLTQQLRDNAYGMAASPWITASLEWPVWLSGVCAFGLSLLGPWFFVLKEDMHENLRV